MMIGHVALYFLKHNFESTFTALSLSFQSNVRVCDLNHVYMNRLSVVERGRLEMLEPFDEFEMFHLTNAHYSLATVSSQSDQSDLFHDLEMPLCPRNPTLTEMPEKRTVQTDLRRFHHAAALQSEPLLFLASCFVCFISDETNVIA